MKKKKKIPETASSACEQIHEENQLQHPIACCVQDFADSPYMAPVFNIATREKNKAGFICKKLN